MYEFNSRVRYSEIDHHGTLTLPALINYFQDCSTFQSEDVGLGTEVLKEEKRAWILSYWQVIAERYPALGERITIGTFPTEFKGLFGNRNFYIKDERGNMIAKAYSVWVFLDTETGRPVRPEEKDIKPYGMGEALDMPYEGRKISLPEETEVLEAFPVRRYHIDTNEHVNNASMCRWHWNFFRLTASSDRSVWSIRNRRCWEMLFIRKGAGRKNGRLLNCVRRMEDHTQL